MKAIQARALLPLLAALWAPCVSIPANAEETTATPQQLQKQITILQDQIKSLKSELAARDS
jgi:starvation-inducible outer membrane lipoprotein